MELLQAIYHAAKGTAIPEDVLALFPLRNLAFVKKILPAWSEEQVRELFRADPLLCMVGEDRLGRILGTPKFLAAYHLHHSLLFLPTDEELEEYEKLLSLPYEMLFSTPSLLKTPASEIVAWLRGTGLNIENLLSAPSLLDTPASEIVARLNRTGMTIDDLMIRPEFITGKTALVRMWPTWSTPSCMHVGDPIAKAFAAALPSEADLESYAQLVESQFPLAWYTFLKAKPFCHT